MKLSVCIITLNEEANIRRTLESVKSIADEIIVVDSQSTDSTVALAQSFGARSLSSHGKDLLRIKTRPYPKQAVIGFIP